MGSGELIDSRYRIERALGSGGACDVWLAEDERLGRKVALKVARPGSEWSINGGTGDPVREAKLASTIAHPNIVAVYDAGRHEGVPYVVMEFVPGKSLREVLGECGRL